MLTLVSDKNGHACPTRTWFLRERERERERESVGDSVASNSLPTINHNP